jgi:hypothetical protein
MHLMFVLMCVQKKHIGFECADYANVCWWCGYLMGLVAEMMYDVWGVSVTLGMSAYGATKTVHLVLWWMSRPVVVVVVGVVAVDADKNVIADCDDAYLLPSDDVVYW